MLSKLSLSFEAIFLAFTVSLGSFEKHEKSTLQPSVGALSRDARQTTHVGDRIIWQGNAHEVTGQMACRVTVN